MDNKAEEQIKQITDNMQCPNDFVCVKSNYETLCKAKNIGMRDFLQCEDQDSAVCKFSLPFGNSYFCKCPMRYFIARNPKTKAGTEKKTSLKPPLPAEVTIQQK